MAGITLRGGRNVLRVFAGSEEAIVTAGTGTQYLHVVHAPDRRKHHRVVAIATEIGRGNVIGWFAKRLESVVTTRARTNYFQVVHSGDRLPGVVLVAGLAKISGQYVIG